MATRTTIKAPKKKVRATPTVRQGSKIKGPSFEGWENWSGSEYHRAVRHARDFYYEHYKPADLLPEVWAWMKENKYSAQDIKSAKASGVPVTCSISCKLLRTGMPDFNKAHDEYWQSLPGTAGVIKPVTAHIKAALEEAISKGASIAQAQDEQADQKANVYVPTIQDRLREASISMMEPIDDQIEDFIRDPEAFDPKKVDILRELRSKEAKAAHARIIKAQVVPAYEEFVDLANIPTPAKLSKMDPKEADLWEQLKEGYSHLNKKQVKKITDFYQEVISACDMLQQEGKVTRKTRKPRQVSKEKLVAKIKYKKNDEALKIVSINPADIIGASELWVYNTKTRKIGKYVASNIDPKGMGRDGTGLNVKGTTIIGFDENASVQKTLRKPAEQLSEFNKAGKVALRKFLDDIKAVDIKLNGRINADTILLKVN